MHTLIDGNTYVPFLLLVTACLTGMGATWRVAVILRRIDLRLERMEMMMTTAWTLSHQQEWERQLKNNNLTLIIPSAVDVNNSINLSGRRYNAQNN